MFSPLTVLSLFLCYMLLLFGVALWVERQSVRGRNLGANPWIYSLSLAVYCTAWTFFGSVGKASTSGFLFLAIYLGTTCAMFLWWLVVRKMIRLKSEYRITSLADLLAARFGKSLLVGGLVSLIALVGTLPYIALQLKSILTSFRIITAAGNAAPTSGAGVDLVVLLLLIGFTIIFGLRRIDPTERHQGMMVIVALESIFKLLALLIIGGFVTFHLFGGFGEILQLAEEMDLLRRMTDAPGAGSNYTTWFSFMLLSASAIIFLPRQFHVAVVENSDERHLATAIWLFPLYLLLINLFVVPIAMGGLLLGLPPERADFFVLLLPLQTEQHVLSLIAFLGGFSASTSMIMITSMAMAIMLGNYLVQPLLGRFESLSGLRRHILPLRWLIVAVFIGFGYLFYRLIGESYMLVNIGIFSFVAVLQFAPATIGGLFWRQANRTGALLGLLAGFSSWLYTIILPALVRSGWLPEMLLTDGPFGLSWLRPEQLFDLEVLPAIPHAVFWCLLFNISGLLLGSLAGRMSQEDVDIADRFVGTLSARLIETRDLPLAETILLEKKLPIMRQLLNQYFYDQTTELIIHRALRELELANRNRVSVLDLSNLFKKVETMLAGAIGAAGAHQVLSHTDFFLPEEAEELSRAYSEMMVSMRISPAELQQKINYYREREELLTSHSQALEEKIEERDREITHRQAVENALRESNERFKELAELLPEIVYEADMAGRLTYANQAAFLSTGFVQEDIDRGLSIFEMVAPEDRERAQLNFSKLLSEEPLAKREYRFLRKDGSHFICVSRSALIIREGQPIGVRGILFDITDIKQAEQEMRHLRNLLKNTIDSMPSVLVGVDLKGRVTQWNREAGRVTGLAPGEAEGRALSEVFPSLRNSMEQVRQAILQQQPLEKLKVPTMINDHAGYADITVYPLLTDENQGAVIRIDDVTERVRIEEMMVQTEKMMSVGGLAAGMAHEINNPLAGILQNIQVIEHRLDQQLERNRSIAESCGTDLETIHRYLSKRNLPSMLEAVKTAGIRAAKIVDNMLSFSRKSEEDFSPHSLTDLFEQTLELAGGDYDLKKKYDFRQIEIVRDFDLDLPPVPCEASQIQQVLFNLLKNGAQAMIEWPERPERPRFVLRLKREEQTALIEVQDNGPGMDETTRKRIFEPFFTTKGVGVGTGLGLSVSYFIITENHRGTMEVISSPGQGAHFIIRLPLNPGPRSDIYQPASGGDRER